MKMDGKRDDRARRKRGGGKGREKMGKEQSRAEGRKRGVGGVVEEDGGGGREREAERNGREEHG